MTKPVARLEWWANPTNLLAIRAVWLGAGWHYTLSWGDGSEPEKVLFWQPPRPHIYPAPGTYTITVRSSINDKVTASVAVVVRPEKSPQATVQPLGGGRVRLALTHISDPVLHRVTWGDDSMPETFTESQLVPVHTYPPGMDTATILVQDVPARRAITLAASIVPPPGGGPTTTWIPELTRPGTGTLHLAGFPPRTRVTAGRTFDTEEDDLVTDDHGCAHRDYALWVSHLDPEDPATPTGFLDCWQSIELRWADPTTGQPRQLWQPANWCEWTDKGCWHKPTGPNEKPNPVPPQNRLPVLLDWDTHRPQVITVAVAPARNGAWAVDWGDGHAENVTVTTGRFTATRDYGRYGSYWVTVTDPAERTGRRRVRPIRPVPKTWKDGSLAIFQAYEEHSNEIGKWVDCDCYSVMRVDAGDGRPLRQIHRPSIYCGDGTGTGFSYVAPGEYTVTMYGPMTDPITYVHQQRTRSRGRGEFPIMPEPEKPGLGATFETRTRWQGGCSGEFSISNTTRQKVASWRLEFRLAAPAVVADVWPNTAHLEPLGADRYAISSHTNLDPDAGTTVGIRVEPAGDPPSVPTDIRATPTSPP